MHGPGMRLIRSIPSTPSPPQGNVSLARRVYDLCARQGVLPVPSQFNRLMDVYASEGRCGRIPWRAGSPTTRASTAGRSRRRCVGTLPGSGICTGRPAASDAAWQELARRTRIRRRGHSPGLHGACVVLRCVQVWRGGHAAVRHGCGWPRAQPQHLPHPHQRLRAHGSGRPGLPGARGSRKGPGVRAAVRAAVARNHAEGCRVTMRAVACPWHGFFHSGRCRGRLAPS
jgi:hypothetical protein